MAPPAPPAYQIQDNRLASFSGITKPKSLAKPAFPLSSSTHPHLTPENLAKAGFYHHPSEQEGHDTCKCFLCGVELGGWDPDDNPFEEHARRGGCAWGEIVCQVNADRKNGKLKTVFDTPESMPSSKQTTSVREQTFKQWWPHKKKGWLPTVKNLARAGFVYTPESGEDDDTVTCPYCQKSLNGWEATDDPMKIHFDKAPQCYFFVAELAADKSGKAANAGTKATGRRGNRATTATAAPSEAAPPEADVDSAVEPAEQTALRQSTRKPPKPRATTTTKAKGGRGRKKAATEDPPEDDGEEVVVVPETQMEDVNAEDDVIEAEPRAEAADQADKAEDVVELEEGTKEKPKSKARKPRATTRGRKKKTDEEEEQTKDDGQDVEAVEAQPPVQPPDSKSSKSSKLSKPSKSKASDEPAQSSDKPSKSSGKPSKPAEKPLPPLPPPSLPTSPQPQPLSQLERFANIPPTSPAFPTPRPKSTLVSSRPAVQPSPRADLPREVLDKSVHQGALEARSVMDDLVKSPVLARIMGGQTDEEHIEIPLTEEQKGMTLEELVRSEMKKRYDALQREGDDMISQWEDRAKEARKRIETV